MWFWTQALARLRTAEASSPRFHSRDNWPRVARRIGTLPVSRKSLACSYVSRLRSAAGAALNSARRHLGHVFAVYLPKPHEDAFILSWVCLLPLLAADAQAGLSTSRLRPFSGSCSSLGMADRVKKRVAPTTWPAYGYDRGRYTARMALATARSGVTPAYDPILGFLVDFAEEFAPCELATLNGE